MSTMVFAVDRRQGSKVQSRYTFGKTQEKRIQEDDDYGQTGHRKGLQLPGRRGDLLPGDDGRQAAAGAALRRCDAEGRKALFHYRKEKGGFQAAGGESALRNLRLVQRQLGSHCGRDGERRQPRDEGSHAGGEPGTEEYVQRGRRQHADPLSERRDGLLQLLYSGDGSRSLLRLNSRNGKKKKQKGGTAWRAVPLLHGHGPRERFY